MINRCVAAKKLWILMNDKKSLLFTLLFLPALNACQSVVPVKQVSPIIECCGGINLSSLVNDDLINCGVTYSGNGFSRKLVKKSDRKISGIVRCAKRAKSQGRPYLVEHNFAMLPDFEESSFMIFKPDNTGFIVSYDSDGETNWFASAKNCSRLTMLSDASTGESNCNQDAELESQLGIKKR